LKSLAAIDIPDQEVRFGDVFIDQNPTTGLG